MENNKRLIQKFPIKIEYRKVTNSIRKRNIEKVKY